MKPRLEVNITTGNPLLSQHEGFEFFQLLQRHVPALLPERYGNYEPLQQRFDGENIGSLLAAWKPTFLWKRRRGRIEGEVSQGRSSPPRQGEITFSLSSDVASQVSLLALIAGLAEAFSADFGLLTSLTPAEIRIGRENKSVHFTNSDGTGAFTYVPPIRLREQFVPDLYWLTLFGPPYIKIFGRERLLSAPAHRVEELAYGGVLLQLTPEIADIEANYFTFLSARNRVKEHLNCDVFFDPKKGADYGYRRPDFVNR